MTNNEQRHTYVETSLASLNGDIEKFDEAIEALKEAKEIAECRDANDVALFLTIDTVDLELLGREVRAEEREKAEA